MIARVLVFLISTFLGAPCFAGVLPNATPEEQYRFALARALDNDLQTAEEAFIEFQDKYPNHQRAIDALFWQGRIQFMTKQYELAAIAFTKFNSLYPKDPRINDTTLWIAESVAKFAPEQQACDIFKELRQTQKELPASLTARIKELEMQSSCEVQKITEVATPSPLTISEIQKLRQHISNCWQPPIAAAETDYLKVDIQVKLKKDGTLGQAEVVDRARYSQDVQYRAAANAARRAIINCQPLPLPPEKYSSWKEFIFGFDPKFIQNNGWQAKARGKFVPADSPKFNGREPNQYRDSEVCMFATFKQGDSGRHWITPDRNLYIFVEEAQKRGLDCGVKSRPRFGSNTKVASSKQTQPNNDSFSINSTSSAELTAAQKEAERLRQELAALKTEQQQEQQRIDSDTQIPLITVLSSSSDDRRGSIAGMVTDNMGVAEVRVDGAVVPLKSDGSFEWQGFVPAGGKSFTIEAIDTAGLSSMQQVRLERGQQNNSSGPLFDELNPFRGKTAEKNRNALALIVGVSDYERTPDPAVYADKDAQYFQDYAAIKLGVPDNNIFTLINRDADEVSIKKAVKSWLLRMSVKDETDVYVFFAGHGLASSDGSNMFLLPYDGDPELLEDSAIDRKQLFADIQAISPRSVTVFLDSCYSGGTRAGGTLVASLRPIAIRAKEQNVPDGFTILSAAKGDQTSQSLEEAKHGLFSYFLMRGLEGDADANNDNQITAGELHSFVTDKVGRQSGFKQTPDLQGDAERVLVRFQ